MKSTQELQQIATQVRRDILRMTTNAKSGHPGGSLGTADWFVAMNFNLMDFDPKNFTMSGEGEDMLFVSQGHITPVIYSTMARRGYFPVSELATFRKFGTRLQGHPSTEHGLPGIRMASGSLGQGMSVGVGAALGKKMTGDKHLVYTMHGDGDSEGVLVPVVDGAGATVTLHGDMAPHAALGAVGLDVNGFGLAVGRAFGGFGAGCVSGCGCFAGAGFGFLVEVARL